MARVFTINDPQYNCPKCGHNKLRGMSAQVCEDGCEMWVECEKCGYDPADLLERVTTVWGWQDEYTWAALEIWRDKVLETFVAEKEVTNE